MAVCFRPVKEHKTFSVLCLPYSFLREQTEQTSLTCTQACFGAIPSSMIVMKHLVCGGKSSFITLLGQSLVPLRQQMAIWTSHIAIQVTKSSE